MEQDISCAVFNKYLYPEYFTYVMLTFIFDASEEDRESKSQG